MDEEVLVVSANVLHNVGYFRGFCTDHEKYLAVLMDPSVQDFLPRSLAEQDPSFKQLIPYVVLRSGDLIYCYSRGTQGTENRLHDKLSIGIGGHVCRQDGALGEQAYRKGLERELEEEVAIDSPFQEKLLGLVHDDRTPVGEVHLGIVHVLELEQPAVRNLDASLTGAEFRPLEEVRASRDRLESWSEFVLDHLG